MEFYQVQILVTPFYLKHHPDKLLPLSLWNLIFLHHPHIILTPRLPPPSQVPQLEILHHLLLKLTQDTVVSQQQAVCFHYFHGEWALLEEGTAVVVFQPVKEHYHFHKKLNILREGTAIAEFKTGKEYFVLYPNVLMPPHQVAGTFAILPAFEVI